jgi:hypothetical protein
MQVFIYNFVLILLVGMLSYNLSAQDSLSLFFKRHFEGSVIIMRQAEEIAICEPRQLPKVECFDLHLQRLYKRQNRKSRQKSKHTTYVCLGMEKQHLNDFNVIEYVKKSQCDLIRYKKLTIDTNFIFKYVYPHSDEKVQKALRYTYSNHRDTVFRNLIDTNKKVYLSESVYYYPVLPIKHWVYVFPRYNQPYPKPEVGYMPLQKILPVESWVPQPEYVDLLILQQVHIYIPILDPPYDENK